MKKTKSVLLSASAAFLLMFSIAANVTAATKLRMASSFPGGPLTEYGAKAFAEYVNQMSDGSLEVQLFPSGSLGSPLKVAETVKNGVADLGHTWIGYDWGKQTSAVLFGGFAGSPDPEVMIQWLYNGDGLKLQREFREKEFDLVSFPLGIRTTEVFLHSRNDVKTLEDLKGLKIRTAGAWLGMLDEMGASPVTVPAGDVFPMLSRGALDATEWGSPWENEQAGLHRIAKYVIVPGVHQPTAPHELVINKKVWNELSEREQWIIQKAAKIATIETWMKLGYEDSKSLKKFEAEGNIVSELDVEVQKTARELAYEWAEKQSKEDPRFAEIWGNQKEFMKTWSQGDRSRSVYDMSEIIQ